MAEQREVLPVPTLPTTATNEPSDTFKLMPLSTGFPSSSPWPQAKVPFSITIGLSEKNKHSVTLTMKYKLNWFFKQLTVYPAIKKN